MNKINNCNNNNNNNNIQTFTALSRSLENMYLKLTFFKWLPNNLACCTPLLDRRVSS